MSNIISMLLPNVHQNPPVSEQTLQELVRHVNLPHDYISMLRLSNGMEGEINEHGYIVLWEAETLIEDNQAYSIEEFVPGCFLIGSNGGELSYGLDLRPASTSYGYYLTRPFISIGWDEVTILGGTFKEFIEVILSNATSW